MFNQLASYYEQDQTAFSVAVYCLNDKSVPVVLAKKYIECFVVIILCLGIIRYHTLESH